MIDILEKKSVGFYFAAFAGVITIIAAIRYAGWATANNVMNPLILAVLMIGIVLNVMLVFYDNDYLMIAITAFYSIGLFQLLADSVGSFVDAFQGINMFGDAAQVGTILSISYFIAAGILAIIVASFMKREKKIKVLSK